MWHFFSFTVHQAHNTASICHALWRLCTAIEFSHCGRLDSVPFELFFLFPSALKKISVSFQDTFHVFVTQCSVVNKKWLQNFLFLRVTLIYSCTFNINMALSMSSQPGGGHVQMPRNQNWLFGSSFYFTGEVSRWNRTLLHKIFKMWFYLRRHCTVRLQPRSFCHPNILNFGGGLGFLAVSGFIYSAIFSNLVC